MINLRQFARINRNVNHQSYIDLFYRALKVDNKDEVIGWLVMWTTTSILSPEAGGGQLPKFMQIRKATPNPETSIEWAVREYNLKHRREGLQCKIIKHKGETYVRHFEVKKSKTDKTKVDVENKEVIKLDPINDCLIYYVNEDWIKEIEYLYRFRRDHYLASEVSTYLKNYIESIGGIQLKPKTNIYFLHIALNDIIFALKDELEQFKCKLYIIPYRFDKYSQETLKYSMIGTFIQDLEAMKERLKELKTRRQNDGYPGGIITDLVKLYKKLAVWKDIFGEVTKEITDNLREFEDYMRSLFHPPANKDHVTYLNERITSKIERIEKLEKIYLE